MQFEWDEAKRLSNLAKHGLDFLDIDEIDWPTVAFVPSSKANEGRFVVLGEFRGRVHVVIVTLRGGRTRVISFRRAKEKEVRRYDDEKKNQF
jgi:uncharacterized DUF497 family protein